MRYPALLWVLRVAKFLLGGRCGGSLTDNTVFSKAGTTTKHTDTDNNNNNNNSNNSSNNNNTR